MKEKFVQMLEQGTQAILEMAGVFNQPRQGARAAGFSRTGQQVFVLNALANSADKDTGVAFAHAYAAIISPFGVFQKKEWDYLQYLAAASKAPKLLEVLDRLYSERKGETFAATILKAVKSTHRHALGVVASVKIYNNWGIMSPAQKAIAIVMLGGQTYLVAPGKALCDLKIVDGKDQSFTVADALNFFSRGKNPYALVENWNQIRNLCRVFNPEPTLDALVDFAEAHNLLSSSPKDSAVPGVTKAAIQKAGGKPAPQYGVGALATPQGSKPPQGYTHAVSTQNGNVIVPTANARSAAGALQGSLVGTKSGSDGITSNALSVYTKWSKEDGNELKDKGAEGGSALLAGLTALKQANPFLYGSLIAFFTHFAGPDVSTSTPNEYFATLAGIALARLVSGKKDYKSDSEGAQIAKQIQSASPADFAKLQTTLRGIYTSFRVSSRSDAYQLANQAYAEERINESDLTAMHEIFDILYGQNGLAAVQKLMNGKDQGLAIAKDKSAPPRNTMLEQNYHIHKEVLKQISKEDNQKRNAARYAKQQQQEQQPDDGSANAGQPDTGADQEGTDTEAPPDSIPPPDAGGAGAPSEASGPPQVGAQ